MQELRSGTQSDSNSQSFSKDKSFKEDLGWNDEQFTDEYASQDQRNKIISLANERLNLKSTFEKYGIHIDYASMNHEGWVQNIHCPFPEHQDHSPSFGFNCKQDFFNCFGCKKAGKSVQFISYLTGKDLLSVAKASLSNNLEKVVYVIQENNTEIINNLTLDFSLYIRDFLRKHNNSEASLEFAEKISWTFDTYFFKRKMSRVDKDHLQARYELLRVYLDKYYE